MSSVDSNRNGMLLASLDQHGNSICLPSSSTTSVDNNTNETIGKYIEANCTSYFNIYNICGSLHLPFDFKNNLLLSLWKLILYFGLLVVACYFFLFELIVFGSSPLGLCTGVGGFLQCVSLIPVVYVTTIRLQNEIVTVSQKQTIKDAEYKMKIVLIGTLICISIPLVVFWNAFFILLPIVLLSTWGVFVILLDAMSTVYEIKQLRNMINTSTNTLNTTIYTEVYNRVTNRNSIYLCNGLIIVAYINIIGLVVALTSDIGIYGINPLDIAEGIAVYTSIFGREIVIVAVLLPYIAQVNEEFDGLLDDLAVKQCDDIESNTHISRILWLATRKPLYQKLFGVVIGKYELIYQLTGIAVTVLGSLISYIARQYV